MEGIKMDIYSPEKYNPDFEVEFGDSQLTNISEFGEECKDTDFYESDITKPEQNRYWINCHDWSIKELITYK